MANPTLHENPPERGSRRAAAGAREAALQALIRFETTGVYPKVVLDSWLRSGAQPEAERGLARELVRGTVVWRGRIDWCLSEILGRSLDGLTAPIRNILRLGAYQILFLDRVPEYAAVSESVRLAKQYGHRGTSGLVNALLRRICRLSPDELLPQGERDAAERIALLWSHPAWMVRRWVDRFGAQEAEALCRANNRIPPVILRHNSTKGPLHALLDHLCADGIRVRPHRLLEGFLVVVEGRGVFESSAFQSGLATAQDVSAGTAVLLLDPKPGEAVLDVCAAPGGKTGFIAERMKNTGRVLALDRSAGRVSRLCQNMARLGLTCVEARVADGLTHEPGQVFDRVLIDVPCSVLGVLARQPDARWRRRETDLEAFAQVQTRLLERSSTFVRHGGVLVYSTCSTEPEENERVFEAFLSSHPEFRIESAQECAHAAAEGPYIRTWPHQHDCDGSFAGRARRIR